MIEAYSRNDVVVIVTDELGADVIADSMEALLHGNPDDTTAREIYEALRGTELDFPA